MHYLYLHVSSSGKSTNFTCCNNNIRFYAEYQLECKLEHLIHTQIVTDCLFVLQKPIRTSSDGDSQIISYRLWWASEQNNYESVLIDGSNTQYTLIGLTGSTTYSLKVQAYTKGGFGPNSTVIELATFAGMLWYKVY